MDKDNFETMQELWGMSNRWKCMFLILFLLCLIVGFLSMLLMIEFLLFLQKQDETLHHVAGPMWNSSESAHVNGANGVDPIYLDLYQEALRRYKKDYDVSSSQQQIPHQLGEYGFVIGPTAGKFKYTVEALQNGKRFQMIITKYRTTVHCFMDSIRICLMISEDHLKVLSACNSTDLNVNERNELLKNVSATSEQFDMACRLWHNNTLFDDIVISPNLLPYNIDINAKGNAHFWMKKLSGYINAPYTHTMFVDSDAYPCPGVEKMFLLTHPNASSIGSFWQIQNDKQGDFAIGLGQHSTDNPCWSLGNNSILSYCDQFMERNTGTVLFSFQRPHLTHTFAHFIPLVAEHIYNTAVTLSKRVTNDQVPFRVALFLFEQFEPDFVEHIIPMHTSCRFAPRGAVTNGFANGMYPIQQDGSHCSECQCTPCLINHSVGKSWSVKINGTMGWE